MFSKLKKELYFTKLHLLLVEGVQNGSIQSFDDELYKRLSHIYLMGVPISIELKYFNPKDISPILPGKCFERSLFLTMGFDNAILVRGDQLDLKLIYGPDSAIHFWVENDDWVYDPSTMLKIQKKLYYKMYKPYNVEYYSKREYENSEEYQDIINTTIDDIKPGGSKRPYLNMMLPFLIDDPKMQNNSDYREELTKHLEEIGYDPDQVTAELNASLAQRFSSRQKRI